MSVNPDSDRRPLAIALLLVLAAAAYRVFATTGDMHFDPVVYAQNAFNVLQGSFNLETDSWFAHRLTVFLPVVPLYAAFGVGTWTSCSWPLLASFVQLALVLWIGWRRLGPAPALLATGLLAFAPLDVLYSSILNPDILIATFMTAAAVFWIDSLEDPGPPSRIGLVLAGAFFALAFVTRVFAVVLVVFFLLHWLWRRPGWKVALPFALGALVIFVPIGVAYWVQTGDPLYRLGVVGGRYATEVKSEGTRFLYYPSLLLHPRHLITGIGPHLLLVGLFGAFLRPNRIRGLLLLWALPILLYLQFGSMSASEYVPILKRERFLLPLSAPLFLLAGDVLWALCRWIGARVRIARAPAALAVAGLALVFAAGFLVVRDQRAGAERRVQAFEQVAERVRSRPAIPVLCDHWRTGYRLSYYLGFEEGADFYRGADDSKRMGAPGSFGDSRLGYLSWYPELDLLPTALVILDDEALERAQAGDDVTRTYRAEEIPGYAYGPPESWSLLGRHGSFRVYLVGG